MMVRHLNLLAALAFTFFVGAASCRDAPGITVGTIPLQACDNGGFSGYCGSLSRPLDPTGTVPGSISIGLEWYPATDTATPAIGTILAEEGGPGSSSTGSRLGYLTLFGSLRDHRNIVIIDKRGTGLSQPVDCHAVRRPFDMSPQVAARCGRELGDTADLFGTALAADDIAAVLQALQTGPVDYYGDSYATYFGQVLLYRHPAQLRTMVLDGAFPVLGETPWFPTEWTAARNAFQLVCERSPSCATLGGSSLSRIAALLDSLRRHPVSGTAPGGGTSLVTVTATPGTLYLLMSYAGHWPTAFRDLDAAARAYLGDGDAAPLLRLVAEASNATGFGLGPYVDSFSTGLYVAVTCSDFPLLWNARAPLDQRLHQYARAVAGQKASDPALFAPFTIDEVLGQPNTLIMPWMCQGWPKPALSHPQGRPVPPNAQFPTVPTLVLSGELDTLTSPAEGALTTALLPGAQQIIVPNLTHETAISDLGIHPLPADGDLTNCVAPIVLNFVQTTKLGNTACAARISPIRTVARFATKAGDVAAAIPEPGNQASEADLRLASAAVETAGDVLARFYVAFGNKQLGLRGGAFRFAPIAHGTRFVLQGVRWTSDLSVSGRMDWNQETGRVVAKLDVLGADGHSGTLETVWDQRVGSTKALISGLFGGRTLSASRSAP